MSEQSISFGNPYLSTGSSSVTHIANVPDNDMTDITRLLELWRNKYPRNLLRSAFYDAKQRFNNLGISIPNIVAQKAGVVVGSPQKSVRALADKSVFEGFETAAGADNLVLWSYGTSAATFVTAVLAPVLGSLADHKGHKKRLFVACLILGVAFTLFSALTDDYRGLLVGYVISHIGFSGSCLFYDAFLTDVTTRERMDRVSAWGYAMGYIGGSTIPFVLAIIILFVMGMENPVAFKLVILLTSVWWLAFSIPFLKNVHQIHYVEAKKGLFRSTFRNLWTTAKDIFTQKRVFFFIIAYFFYIDGVNTIISISTSYGTTLGLDTVGMILALLVTQIVAMPFSILFGKLAGKVGSINLLCGSVGIYFVITVVGFIMGFNIEQNPGSQSALMLSQVLFWCMAFLVGTVQGGIQALSRSYFGKLIPADRSNEYFGFFDIFGKFAAVIGPLLVALFTQFTGRDSIGVISLAILFLIGGAILLAGRKTLFRTEEK